jgi:hypothetical protein
MVRTLFFWLKVFITQVLLFLYLYSIPLKGLPFGIGTRIVFSICGLLIVVYGLFSLRIKFNFISINRFLLSLLSFVLLLVITIYTSCFINSTNDTSLIRISFSYLLTILSVYFFYRIISNLFPKIFFLSLLNMIVICSVIQVSTALLMFVSPDFKELIISMIDPKDFLIEEILLFSNFRLIGLGSNPFVTGFTNGFSLILLSFLINKNQNRKLLIFYIVSFLMILVVGSMIARTTLIGGFLSICSLLLSIRLHKINLNKLILKMLMYLGLVLFLVIFIKSLDKGFVSKINDSFEYGFEALYNLKSGHGAQTESTNELKEMYFFPDKLSTYIIGDGYYMNPYNSLSYYMNTDAGYIRLLYYIGLFGLAFYLAIQLLPIGYVYFNSQEKQLKQFCLLLMIFFLLLMIKGVTDLFFLSYLIMYFFKESQKTTIK